MLVSFLVSFTTTWYAWDTSFLAGTSSDLPFGVCNQLKMMLLLGFEITVGF